MPFSKWLIDITIQLQALIVYIHKAIIYTTTQLAKVLIHNWSCSEAPKPQQVER